jgi:GNAT superfamily N-acetyltransferase
MTEWPTWRDNSAIHLRGDKSEYGLMRWRIRTTTPSTWPSFPEAESQVGSECTYFVLSNKIEQDSCAGISGLIVDQEVRSREIGKVLLGAAEEWARSQGCDAISVHTNVTRERAHRFYARNGYEHIKTQKYLRKSL